MYIAIDTTALHSAHQVRGVGSYTKSLISALQKHEGKHTYSFFVRGENVPKHVDIIHIPYFDPFFLTLSPFHTKPAVVTVHDLIPLAYPQHFPSGLRGRVKWQVQRFALSRTNGVITDSNASRMDIVRIAHVPIVKIHVIPLAADEQYNRVTDEKVLTRVRTSYHLPQSFVLYVGDINWNKNIPGLLRAFKMYRKNGRAELVLAGKAFLDKRTREAQEIDGLIKNLGLESSVIRTGYIDPKDLPAVYSLAHAYIQPSFAEGFGLPVLEAMACGALTICSDKSSLREIAGPSLLVDPNHPEAIALALERVFSLNVSEYAKLSMASTFWASEFSWKKTAGETISAYEKILGNI